MHRGAGQQLPEQLVGAAVQANRRVVVGYQVPRRRMAGIVLLIFTALALLFNGVVFAM
jgi:hypothetical protein